MGKHVNRQRHEANVYDLVPEANTPVFDRKPLTPKNAEQAAYINAIKNHNIVVCLGTVGSGKTFIPAVMAADYLDASDNNYDKVTLVRPNEPLGKPNGFLTGDLVEKMKPYLVPITDGMESRIGETGLNARIRQGKVEFCAIEYMRGRSWNNRIVILDEFQNMTEKEVAVALLRKGMDCKLIFTGDLKQTDLKKGSGVNLILRMLEKYQNCPIKLVELTQGVRAKETEWFVNTFNELGVEY